MAKPRANIHNAWKNTFTQWFVIFLLIAMATDWILFPTHLFVNAVEPNYILSTIVGGGNIVGDGLKGVEAILKNPSAVAIHPITGEIYFADSEQHRIRKIDVNGGISSVAGYGQLGYSGDGGLAVNAKLNYPLGLAINSLGEIYVSDSGNHCVRKIGLNGNMTTFAGQCQIAGINNRLNKPKGIAIGLQNDEVFIVDFGNAKVKKFYSNGTFYDVAGNGFSGDASSSLATETILLGPYGVCVKSNGDFYLTESEGNMIRKVSNGLISLVAGVGFAGSNDGSPTTATFNRPTGIAIHPATEVLYVADSNNHIVRSITDSQVTTIAGTRSAGFSDGTATSSSLSNPLAVACSYSSVYIADSSNHRIRNVSSNIMSTIAGTSSFGHNILANSTISKPVGNPYIYQDSLIFSDSYNLIRKVNLTTGMISTLVGGFSFNSAQQIFITSISNSTQATFHNQFIYFLNSSLSLYSISSTSSISLIAGGIPKSSSGFSGDGGLAIYSQLNNPYNIAFGNRNELYIADYGNKRIRMVENGTITTFAGTGETFSLAAKEPDTAINSRIGPTALAIDSLNDMYFSDYDSSRIRRILANGRIDVTAGKAGVSGFCRDLAVQPHASDNNNYRVRRVDKVADSVTTIAGNGISGYSGDSGLATLASLSSVRGIAVASTGEIYVSDFDNHVIRKIDQAGIISTIAGTGTRGMGLDGLALSSSLDNPSGLAIDSSNAFLYIADFGNNRVRKLTFSNGIITTIAGTGIMGYSGDGGLAIQAQLNAPIGVTITSARDLYITEYRNHRVRKVSNGNITTIAGGGIGDSIPASNSYINAKSFTHNANGEILIADSNNHRIRKIDPNGNITTIAGTGNDGYGGDNGLATGALLNYPTSVISNVEGEIFIADFGNNRIRKIMANGKIMTVAGSGEYGYSGDGGLATNAKLAGPTSVAFLPGGELLIADQNNHIIRKVFTNGTIRTIGGISGSDGFEGDGYLGVNGKFNGPSGISVDQTTGEIYITDSNNNRIRKLKPKSRCFFFGNNHGII